VESVNLTAHAFSEAVQGADEGRIAGASICVLEVLKSAVAQCTATDAQGKFTLQAASKGADSLLASAAGYLPLRPAIPAENGAASDSSMLLLTVERGGSELKGSVLDATGGHVVGALVIVHSLSSFASSSPRACA
jgi:hypothetical protein